MKKTIKLIAVMLVLVMTLATVPAFTVSAADDANTVLVGAGQTYELISAAITGLGADVAGKTIKLTSDIAEPSSIKFDLAAITDAVTIDGDGHTITLKSGFIAIDCALTLKNIKFTQTAVAHPIVYARGNSNVVVENCTTDDTFAYCFGLNAAGNCHITVNSGYYYATQKVFNLDIYDNNTKDESSVTINGGTFVADGGNVATISAKTKLDIKGGNFVSTTDAAFIVDTKNALADGASLATVTVAGANFFAPANNLGILAQNADPEKTATVNMTADNTNKLYTIIPEGKAGANYYGSISNGEFKKLDAVTAVESQVTKVTEIANAFATAYLADGTKLSVNADVIMAMNNSLFHGTTIVLTADTDVAVDLANAIVRINKNGKNAPNLTSSNANSLVVDAYTTNFKDGITGIQTKTNSDGTVSARVIVPIASLNYSKAGVVWTKGEATDNLKYNNLGKYAEGVKAVETTDAYTSFIAGGVTLDAAQCGGNVLVILTIDGLAAGDTISFKAYGITAAGAEYTEARTYTIPAAQ